MMGGANFGNMVNCGGVDAAFNGAPNKPYILSAALNPSSPGPNYVAKNWSASFGAPIVPSSLGPVTQSYVINQAVVTAPVDAAFLGSSIGTTIGLDGSSNASIWTSLTSSTTAGLKGEVITLTSSSTVFYAYHRITVIGDGNNPVSIAEADLSTTGPSAAQTGSELGA